MQWPAFAPGTRLPEVGVFTSAQGLALVRGIIGLEIAGFDIGASLAPVTINFHAGG